MTEAYTFAQFWISLVLLVAIYFGIFRKQRAERCRSRLRVIRDRLFDFMWQNGQDFENPAYKETRRAINGMMRLTSAVGPIQFLIMLYRCRHDHTSRAIDSLSNGPLKAAISSAADDATRTYFKFLFLGGVVGAALDAAQWTLRAMRFVVNFKNWLKSKSYVLWDVANFYGDQNLTPRQKLILR